MNELPRILIADDHALLRKGLRQVIEADGACQVVGEAADGKQALDLLLAETPDMVILDVHMPEVSGFAVAEEVRRRKLDVAIIFLTMHHDKGFFNKALDLGARGYVLKDGALEEIVQAIKAVWRGQSFISPPLSGYLLQRLERVGLLARQAPALNDLTPTERRILKLIAEYKTSKEIAEILHIHYRTVDNHRTNIAAKLGLHGSHAVLKFAVEHKEEV